MKNRREESSINKIETNILEPICVFRYRNLRVARHRSF
jgi:hypothetical protein